VRVLQYDECSRGLGERRNGQHYTGVIGDAVAERRKRDNQLGLIRGVNCQRGIVAVEFQFGIE